MLKTDADFENAIMFQTEVEVYIDGEPQEKGTIESYTADSVKINGGHYLRGNCEFRTKK